jgi:hypothetical protein
MLLFAALETQKRGMTADLIVGSVWPFRGEFLKENETIQRIIVHKIHCSGWRKTERGFKKSIPEGSGSTQPKLRGGQRLRVGFYPAGTIGDSVHRGNYRFKQKQFIKKPLEIKVTTVLSNYVVSLENNPTAERWNNCFQKIPIDIKGNVTVM